MSKKQFKAESKRLLDLMINSIYTNKEIFLREIISNASDAIDKLCYLSLTDDKVGLSRDDFHIDVIPDKEARTLTVRDNGIGMSAQECENNLGVIAKSGSLNFKNEMEEGKGDDLSIIGQFGVGFYSAFMVSDKVTVVTRKYGEESGVKWESAGADGYTVTPCERESVGTDVIMHLKPDSDEELYGTYLEIWKLKALIRKYSDYVRWPIRMDVPRQEREETGEKNDDGSPKFEYRTVVENETVNSMIPIWQRSRKEVTDDDCIAYYKEHNREQKDPCALIRVDAEGTVSYKAMLFVPGESKAADFYGEGKSGVTLYSNGVMIMEKCDKLLHDYFEFVKGVVDSPDLSLNISREILQHDRQLRVIGQVLQKLRLPPEGRRLRRIRPLQGLSQGPAALPHGRGQAGHAQGVCRKHAREPEEHLLRLLRFAQTRDEPAAVRGGQAPRLRADLPALPARRDGARGPARPGRQELLQRRDGRSGL